VLDTEVTIHVGPITTNIEFHYSGTMGWPDRQCMRSWWIRQVLLSNISSILCWIWNPHWEYMKWYLAWYKNLNEVLDAIWFWFSGLWYFIPFPVGFGRIDLDRLGHQSPLLEKDCEYVITFHFGRFEIHRDNKRFLTLWGPADISAATPCARAILAKTPATHTPTSPPTANQVH
jgi:hypothetical protein